MNICSNGTRELLVWEQKGQIDMAEDKNIFFDSYELEQSDLADLADLFKVFGDATRISIMFALLKQELSVGDIAERLEMNASAISHQLRVLKQAKLIKSRREGKNIIYSLADEHVVTIIKQGVDHILE